MLVIRLSRIGKKKKPIYRIIVQEKAKTPSSRYLEQVGFYNPHLNPSEVKLKEDRIKYWLSQGAKASPTLFNILVNFKLVAGPKIHLGKPKKKKEEDKEAGKKELKEKPISAKEVATTNSPSDGSKK